jgi:hypothetical protein
VRRVAPADENVTNDNREREERWKMRERERKKKKQKRSFSQSSFVICHSSTPLVAEWISHFWIVICHDFARAGDLRYSV